MTFNFFFFERPFRRYQFKYFIITLLFYHESIHILSLSYVSFSLLHVIERAAWDENKRELCPFIAFAKQSLFIRKKEENQSRVNVPDKLQNAFIVFTCKIIVTHCILWIEKWMLFIVLLFKISVYVPMIMGFSSI